MTTHDAYRSDTLLVRHVPGANTGHHVVTFDPWHLETSLDRPGFGEAALRKLGITATHVLTRGNDWYQYPDLPEALAAVRALTGGASRVMTYGTSMGAYAAVRFADAVGADAVLAISPQYSVDERRAPFEQRWGQVQRTIRFIAALDGPVRCRCSPVIVYDPKDIDRHHVALFRADIAIAEVRVAHAGHPATTYLQQAGVLRETMLAVLYDRLDVAALERALRAHRRASSHYLSLLAEAQPPHRPRTAAALARRATEIAPGAAGAHHFLALQLRKAGDYPGAIAAHEASIAIERGPVLVWDHAITLLAADRLPEALAAAREVEAAFPASADVKYLIARILKAQRRTGEVVRLARDLTQLDPRNEHYRELYRQSVRRLWRERAGRLIGARP